LSAGRGIVQEAIASHRGLIYLLLMSHKKLQRKDFSGNRLPATLCLRVNRSPRQVIVFLDFPDSGAGICGTTSDAGIAFSARTLRIACKKTIHSL
jgi:hypothetical protein